MRKQLVILVTMYLGYGMMMVCRQMVTILSPALLADEALGITKTDIGDFAAWGTIGALVGKLIWGPLADRIGGRITFLLGLFFSALLITAFGLSPNVLVFTAASFLLYCAKSAGWPGMTKLVGEWYHPKHYGRVWGVLSTSSRLSVVLGTLFFGWLLGQTSWRTVAFTTTGFAVIVTVLCLIFLKEKPVEAHFLESTEPEKTDEKALEAARSLENKIHHPLLGKTLLQALLSFAKSTRCWLVIVMLMVLTCMMAFLDFVPVYLMEVYNLTPSRASMASSVFPIGSLAGLLAAVAFYDRFSRKGLRRILTIQLAAATGCILILQALPTFGLESETTFFTAMSLILLFGFMISPAYYIPMSVFSIEYGGPFSATLVCLIDAFGFAASASFGFIGGRLADSDGGWFSFMNMLIFVGAAGVFSVWAFMNAEVKAELQTIEKSE